MGEEGANFKLEDYEVFKIIEKWNHNTYKIIQIINWIKHK